VVHSWLVGLKAIEGEDRSALRKAYRDHKAIHAVRVRPQLPDLVSVAGFHILCHCTPYLQPLLSFSVGNPEIEGVFRPRDPTDAKGTKAPYDGARHGEGGPLGDDVLLHTQGL